MSRIPLTRFLLPAILLAVGSSCGTRPVAPEPDVWPNAVSRANGDPWLMENHTRIRRMEPRLLVLNFDNHAPRAHLENLVSNIVEGLAESSRWHGYKAPSAPEFLRHRIARFVDLREPDAPKDRLNAAAFPLKPGVAEGFNVDHNAFFGDAFAARIGVADPDHPGRFLRLDELVDRGEVHEVWILSNGDDRNLRAYECVELMPRYDAGFHRLEGPPVQAGNGGDPDQRWTGRSLRLGFVNTTRGPGCFLESLAHSFEEMANCGSIPWLKREFEAFAGFDLKDRWGTPFRSFYALRYGERIVEYPRPDLAVLRPWKGDPIVLSNYVAGAGNAHWPPNARQHYDLANTNAVLSTVESWREGGPRGEGFPETWNGDAFRPYGKLAPDCMGPWLVYWRQNFPGPGNRATDHDGRPMRNWWPFLFY